jgi:GH15 family glucan-1,4-alpha-glucosidase
MPDAPPIADYALLGDRHTAALVSREGSVDWLCLPRFDSGSCFARLLDPAAGSCTIALGCPADAPPSRRYLDGTMVLETTLHGAGGEVRLLDCLVDDAAERGEERVLLRIVEGVRGAVPVRLRVEPRFDYGEVEPWVRHHAELLWSAIGGDDGLLCWCDASLERAGRHALEATATVHGGQRVRLALAYRRPAKLADHPAAPTGAELDAALEGTLERWRAWSARGRGGVPGAAAANRSALVLKALTYAPSGAMVAAATTSLPEGAHGERTWDYRYSWIRDAVLATRCLAELGFEADADAFRRFIERSAAGNAADLRVFYGVGGERRMPEQQLDLRGYEGGTVRVGNVAATQLQLDAYGHLLEQSWRAFQRGESPDDDYWRFIVELVDAAVERWREPDAGIWEWRGDGRHFVYSKALCWLACERGLALAERCMRKAPERRWRAARDEIREAVLAEGYDEGRGTFVQAFGLPDLDASVLRLPGFGFVAYDDPRMLSTADVLAGGLEDGGLLRRYDSDDGLPGREGAFLACTFWLVECLALQGRHDDARGWFDRAMGTANDLALFSEEFDPASGRMLGNFPQALTHLSQIEAALALGASRASRA